MGKKPDIVPPLSGARSPEVLSGQEAEAALRESEARYRSLFQNNHAVMLLIDPGTGEIVDANPAACAFYGYSLKELTAKNITGLNTLTADEVFEEMHRAESEQRHFFKFRHRLAGGELREVEVLSGPITVHGRGLLYSIVHDVTQLRRAEEALQQAYAEMEERVRERTAALTFANEQLLREMEERLEAEEALRRSEERFRTLFQTAGNVIVLLDLKGGILEFNQEAEQATGYKREEVVGRNAFELFIPEEFRPQVEAENQKTPAGEISREYEIPLLRRDGTRRLFMWNSNLFKDASGQPGGIIAIGQDITARKEMEEALRQSQASLAEAQRLARLGNWEWDLKTDELRWSEEIYAIFGLSPGDFKASYEAFQRAIPPEDLEMVQQAVDDALYRGKPYRIQHRILLPGGQERVVQEQGEVFFDDGGQPLRMVGTVQDITELKQAEMALKESQVKLRYLSSQLLSISEKERRRISYELHDELGQALAFVKLQARSIEKRLRPDQEELKKDCLHILAYLDELIENIRRLSRDLSPAILEDLGLSAALRHLLDEFKRNFHVDYTFKMPEINRAFSPESQIVIYRIFQESLNNIGKHAQATQVSVTIKKQGGNYSFNVADNGMGFDVSQVLGQLAGEKGLGLDAMDERVRMLGGAFEIWSKPGMGTQITFVLPKEGGDGNS